MAQTPTETIKNYYKPLIRFIDNSIKNDGGELPNFKSELQEILDQFNPTNFAVYSVTSDIMYTIRQALMADKKITAKEIKVVGPLVKSILKKFSELRKDYRNMIDVPDEKLWDSIQYWHKDEKPFGWGFAATQIVGIELIAFYSITQNNPTIFLDYKNMLSALYQSVLEADGMSEEEIVKLKEFNLKLNEISKIDFLKNQYKFIVIAQLKYGVLYLPHIFIVVFHFLQIISLYLSSYKDQIINQYVCRDFINLKFY